MHIDIKDKKRCCGCGACKNICKHNCITMQIDDEGFCYPQLDLDLCVDCGQCLNVCPVINTGLSRLPQKAYYGHSNDEHIRFTSSSGGIFSEIAQYILNKGGVVYGSCFSSNMKLIHKRISDKEGLNKLRGSKYLQSSMTDIYESVNKDLKEGLQVLFVGTPCQIKALNNYFKLSKENLICIDFVCHGVPSQKVFDKYINHIENLYHCKVINAEFRNKTVSWGNYSMKLYCDDGRELLFKKSDDLYLKSFLKNVSIRPSCYDCANKSFSSGSDITLGDCWRIVNTNENDGKGISIIFVNSDKGEEIISSIYDRVNIKETDVTYEISNIKNISRSTPLPRKRGKFMKNIDIVEFDKLANKYASDNLYHKIRHIAAKYLKQSH